MRWSLLLFLSLSMSVGAQQASTGQAGLPAPQHKANFDAERHQADELFVSGKHREALPLYEDLAAQDQTVPVFAERHGMLLLEKAETTADAKQKNGPSLTHGSVVPPAAASSPPSHGKSRSPPPAGHPARREKSPAQSSTCQRRTPQSYNSFTAN